MITFLWDESANEDVLRAWREQTPDCDVLTVHQAHLSGVSDQEIADWAGAHDRVIVSAPHVQVPEHVVGDAPDEAWRDRLGHACGA